MKNGKMKYHVGLFGVGAIGSVIGASLSQNESLSISYFNRSNRNSVNIKFGECKQHIPVKMETDFNLAKALDWLIIAIKAYDYDKAKSALKELITPQTNVVLIRNGLYLFESLGGLVNRNNVLECLIDCPTQKDEEGYYTQIRKGKIIVQANDLSDRFAAFFLGSNRLVVEQVADFKTASWEKLIESSALGAILTLSGTTCWIFENKEIVKLYEEIVRESIEVALADGAKIASNYTDQLVLRLKKYPNTKGSSMLTDRLNNRRIELMAKNGIIAELGKKYAIKTPLNDLICKLLKYTNTKKI